MTRVDPADVPDDIESGAIAARSGFNWQDEFGLICCLDMCSDLEVSEVRCESLDDIAVIHLTYIEYVQAKDVNLGQLWSVAKLTTRESGRLGTSLLEKSLSRAIDGFQSRFTIATSLGVKPELAPLTHPLGDELRDDAAIAALASSLATRLTDAAPAPNGTTVETWAQRAHWKNVGAADVLHLRVNEKLRRVAVSVGLELTEADVEQVRDALLGCVRKASDSRVPSDKRFTRADFRLLVEQEIERIRDNSVSGYAAKARQKMEEAGIDTTAIRTAIDHRLRYRQEILSPRYCDSGMLERVAWEVQAQMALLRGDLACSCVDVTGPEFHLVCMKKVAEIADSHPDVPLPLALGSLYDLTNRCLHRFN